MRNLHQRICEIAKNQDLAKELEMEVSREEEIIRLHRPAVRLDVNMDGVIDGPLYPTLDANQAPFTGTEFVTYSLSSKSESLRVDGYVLPDLALEIESEWPEDVKKAMRETYRDLLDHIGIQHSLR